MATGKNDEQPKQQIPRAPIEEFLAKRSSTYRELSELRIKGWESKEGDAHFARQRQKADGADEHGRKNFFDMMKRIGDEMQAKTSVFSLSGPHPKMLDLCMAPGGYTASCLKHAPETTSVRAITLPKEDGGHKVIAPDNQRLQIHFTDITMLVSEISPDEPIPSNHPDVARLIPSQTPFMAQLGTDFDLVFCDGQVLRTHPRSSYRERSESRRLVCAQLIIALQRIKPGGSLVVLLHRLHAFRIVKLLSQFDQFATVRLFKPLSAHRNRSSFYMVATNVQPNHPIALDALEGWRAEWRDATLVGYNDPEVLTPDPEETSGESRDSNDDWAAQNVEAELILHRFGDRLVELGEQVWEIQRDELRRAPFINGKQKDWSKNGKQKDWSKVRGIGPPLFGTKMGHFGVNDG